ncbi:hypothetical protein EJB05_27413 [Eragrostis curvula]|uniref:Uncharacterized protein n=1 Tax=Eragrostis curvula TaxID=38414 RepID=A0A5J9UMG7_9POAL|nr:hypothetical protein EJB05_27413 [Eragrostis curvula]
MATTSFSVAAAASELATKVRAWLGGQTLTSPDVAPARYQLETTALTSEKYAVVLAAVYTVGPRSLDGKFLTPPDHRHVSALAAGMSTVEMLVMGFSCFVYEALRRVNLDLLANSGGGGGGVLLVYGARVERLAVEVPCDRVSLAVVAEEGAAPTTAFDLCPVAKLEVILPGVPGAFLVLVAGPTEQIKVDLVGVMAEYHMELHGKTTLRIKVTGNITVNSSH